METSKRFPSDIDEEKKNDARQFLPSPHRPSQADNRPRDESLPVCAELLIIWAVIRWAFIQPSHSHRYWQIFPSRTVTNFCSLFCSPIVPEAGKRDLSPTMDHPLYLTAASITPVLT